MEESNPTYPSSTVLALRCVMVNNLPYTEFQKGDDVVVRLAEPPDAGEPKRRYAVGTVTRGGNGNMRTVVCWNGSKIRASVVGEPDMPVILGLAPPEGAPESPMLYREAKSLLTAGRKFYRDEPVSATVAATTGGEAPENRGRKSNGSSLREGLEEIQRLVEQLLADLESEHQPRANVGPYANWRMK